MNRHLMCISSQCKERCMTYIVSQTPEDRASQKDGLGAESQGLENIGSFADSSVDINLHISVLDSVQDLWKSVDLQMATEIISKMYRIFATQQVKSSLAYSGKYTIQLSSSVIADHDTLDSDVGSQLCILGR